MSRRSEQWFHLLISAFGLSLAFASILAIEYQRSPGLVRSWLAPLQHVSSLSVFPGLQKAHLKHPQSSQQPVAAIAHQHRQQTIGSHNLKADNTVSQPALSQESQALSKLVRVKAFNSNVPTSEVVHAQQLLKQYNIIPQIASFLGFSLHTKATIELVDTSADYEKSLQSVGVVKSQTPRLSLDTGGFTNGTTVIVPLYQNKTTPELVNTLTHELTHVFLNENGGSLPSWVNEGTAVHMGMLMQSKAESNLVYSGYAKRMAENVLTAVKADSLRPLTGNEQKVIQGGASYDIELQDWLAVNMLLDKQGKASLQKFFRLIHNGQSAKGAFTQAFGTSQSHVNAELTQLLKSAADKSDKGVSVALKVPSGFKGELRILPHASHNWDGIRLHPGLQKFTLLPNGSIEGYSGTVEHTYDSRPVDKKTVYINLDPSNPFLYNGEQVADSGFALDYHDGLYGFVNGFITLSSGKTIYTSQPSLFGVQLQMIREQSQIDPVLTLLQISH